MELIFVEPSSVRLAGKANLGMEFSCIGAEKLLDIGIQLLIRMLNGKNPEAYHVLR